MRVRELSHSAWARSRRSFNSAIWAVSAALAWAGSSGAEASWPAGTGGVSGGVSFPTGCLGVSCLFSACFFMSSFGSLYRRQGDVVVLWMAAAKALHLLDNRFHQEIDALRAGRSQHGLELFQAKFVSLVIERFVDSIGIHHHGVQWREVHCNIPDDFVKDIAGVDSEGDSRRFDDFDVLEMVLAPERRLVAGPGQGQDAAGGVHDQVDHGDEHVFPDVGVK